MLHRTFSGAAETLAMLLALTFVAIQAGAQVGPPPNSPPTIILFGNPAPNAIVTVSGTAVEFSVLVLGNPSPTCSIDNGIGTVPCSAVPVLPATVSVSPTLTTTYTLTATNSAGTVTAQATVIVLLLPQNPPEPGLLTSLSGKNTKQIVLPPQYHYTFATGVTGFIPAFSGDLALPSLTPGNNVDEHGNMFSQVSAPPPTSSKLAIFFIGSTAYAYDPNGGRSLFGATSGTCTQNGQFVTNDYTVIANMGYDPIALAYYVKTNHVSQSAYTNDPNACSVDSTGNFYYYSAGSGTEALIKITKADAD